MPFGILGTGMYSCVLLRHKERYYMNRLTFHYPDISLAGREDTRSRPLFALPVVLGVCFKASIRVRSEWNGVTVGERRRGWRLNTGREDVVRSE